MTVYGIKNCDTIKKTLNWLKANDISFNFHDYKKEGISENKLREWCLQVGWESIINKKGTTWRKLNDSIKENVKDETDAIAIMLSNTSIIKRPIIEKKGQPIIVGFSEETYEKLVL